MSICYTPFIMPPIPSGPEKIVYQGKMIEVVQQLMKVGEKNIMFEFARRAPGTRLIIPMKSGKILLTKESRREIKGYDIRLPGGKVFDTLEEYNSFLKTGADIVDAAHRAAIKEAREEVGVIVKNMELLRVSKCGTSVEWDLFYFLVTSHTEGEREDSGEGEDITALPTDPEEVKKMCLDGRIQEDRSAIMLLRFLNKE